MPTVDPEAQAFGRALAAAREERGWKRKDLAEASDLSYPYLSEIEKGSKRPSARALEALAGALGRTPAELMTRGELLRQRDSEESSPSFPAMPPLAAMMTNTRQGPVQEEMIVARVTAAVNERLRAWLEIEVPRMVREELRRTEDEQR